VAVHCLYGVDKNPLAVELAKLALWLESYAEGLPLTFMDHRLVCGDSLTGPFIEHLATLPGRGEKMSDDLFERFGARLLGARIKAALEHVRDLEASVGKDVAEVEQKRAAKERLDRALEPLRVLARVWSGGVMLGEAACDDLGYTQLVAVAAHEEADAIPAMEAVIKGNERLRRMREVGAEGVAYELVFPEVFWPEGYTGERQGFDAVLGNPPWDTITPKEKEWIASFDIAALDARSATERERAKVSLLKQENIKNEYDAYLASFERFKRSNDRLYLYQKVSIDGDLAGRFLDAFRVFAERCAQLLAPNGSIGLVLPSAFHANEGAAGVRNLYINSIGIRYCFSFENRKKIFDIHASFKFDLIVAQKSMTSRTMICAFYLEEPTAIFEEVTGMQLTPAFIKSFSGEYLTFPEIRSNKDYNVLQTVYSHTTRFGGQLRNSGIKLAVELNLTKDERRFEDARQHGVTNSNTDTARAAFIKQGLLVLTEGKHFNQYNDRWGPAPTLVVPAQKLLDRPDLLKASNFYRFGFRSIASATNERTVIFALLSPGVIFAHSVNSPEREPFARTSSDALKHIAVANTFTFDYLARQAIGSNVSAFIIYNTPAPRINIPLLSHSALRLTCNHAGYEALWREQLGAVWREPERAPHDWPVLSNDDARWQVRAEIDAVVAEAYGLTRAQYEHVLAGFSHKSYPKAPTMCLAMFDELKAIGLEAFVRKHDPYWDVPLVETLPKPVIELKVPAAEKQDGAAQGQLGLAGIVGAEKPKRGRRKGA
jgi:hypothetical protein